MFTLKTKNKMIEALQDGNVVVGKYMYSNMFDILSLSDEANTWELAWEEMKRSGDIRFEEMFGNNVSSEAFSIQDGDNLIPLVDTYMVNAYQKYRSDLKENDSVIGFCKKIPYEQLDKKDIAFIYDLYQAYKARKEMEHGQTKQLRR